jgi:hypothetical protein
MSTFKAFTLLIGAGRPVDRDAGAGRCGRPSSSAGPSHKPPPCGRAAPEKEPVDLSFFWVNGVNGGINGVDGRVNGRRWNAMLETVCDPARERDEMLACCRMPVSTDMRRRPKHRAPRCCGSDKKGATSVRR